jgi:hypothetical protein
VSCYYAREQFGRGFSFRRLFNQFSADGKVNCEAPQAWDSFWRVADAVEVIEELRGIQRSNASARIALS